jgi:hypothetical protein
MSTTSPTMVRSCGSICTMQTQMPSLASRLRSRSTGADVGQQAVDEHLPAWTRSPIEAAAVLSSTVSPSSQTSTCSGMQPGLDGDVAVGDHVPRLAVDGDEELRLHDVVEQDEVLAVGVTGDVHVREPLWTTGSRAWPAR